MIEKKYRYEGFCIGGVADGEFVRSQGPWIRRRKLIQAGYLTDTPPEATPQNPSTDYGWRDLYRHSSGLLLGAWVPDEMQNHEAVALIFKNYHPAPAFDRRATATEERINPWD